MTLRTQPPILIADDVDPSGGYRPGVCNIGPAEITRRRRTGHIGLVATLIVLAALVVTGAPPLARFVLVVPVGLAASGYLQAALKFCAGFGSAGIFNFGVLGETVTVADATARKLDQARARQILLASLAIGIAVSLVAFVLPL